LGPRISILSFGVFVMVRILQVVVVLAIPAVGVGVEVEVMLAMRRAAPTTALIPKRIPVRRFPKVEFILKHHFLIPLALDTNGI
jgi:hypothetical protein